MADEADRTTWLSTPHRSRARLGRVLIVASVVTILARATMAIAGTAGWAGAWVLVTAVALTVATVVSQLWDLRQQWRSKGLDDRRRLRSILLIDPPPVVASADPHAVGVFRSQLAEESAGSDRPPYVRRDIDKALDTAFTPEQLAQQDNLVVLCGEPGSGLSRTLWEALARNLGDRKVYALVDPSGYGERALERRPIETLLQVDPGEAAQTVLWLDDAHEHLERGLTLGNLRSLRQWCPGIVVVATLHSDKLAVIRQADRALGRLLESAQVRGMLRHELSAPEIDRARQAYPTLATEAELARLPAWFKGVDLLRGRYEEARASNRHGAAVTRAAIDWRRAGMPPAVPRRELRALASIELEQMAPHQRLTDESFAAALEWATAETTPGVSLLRPMLAGPVQFRADDVITGWASKFDGPVSPACWAYVVKRVHSDTGLRVGYQAYLANLPQVSEPAWKRVASSRNRETAPRAQLHLGDLYHELGRPGDAEDAYKSAIASGHPEAGPRAQLHLGELFAGLGRVDDAAVAYRAAIASAHPDIVAWAQLGLGHLLTQLGRSEAATAALRAATESGQSEVAARAQYDLGRLFVRLGRPGDATAAFSTAMRSGDPEVARWAAASLHGQLKGLGVDAAAHGRVVADRSSRTKLDRADLLADVGRSEEAEIVLREVISSGHPDAKPWAQVGLGHLCEGLGRLGEAEAAFGEAIVSGHARVVPWARFDRAKLLMKQGRHDEAEKSFRDAIAGGDQDVAPLARLSLASLLEEQGHPTAAEAALRDVIVGCHPTVETRAQLALGKLLTKLERHAEAEIAFGAAIGSGEADVAAWAQFHLAELWGIQGRYETAVEAYRSAIASRHKEVVIWARFDLARLFLASGRDDQAVVQLRKVATSAHPEAAGLAKEALDNLRRR